MCMTQNMGAIFFENRGVWHKMYDTKKATNLLRKNVLQQVNNNLFRNKWRNFPAFWTIGSPWNIAVFRLEKAWSAAASNDTTISEPFCVVQQRVKQFFKRKSEIWEKSRTERTTCSLVFRTHNYFTAAQYFYLLLSPFITLGKCRISIMLYSFYVTISKLVLSRPSKIIEMPTSHRDFPTRFHKSELNLIPIFHPTLDLLCYCVKLDIRCWYVCKLCKGHHFGL